VRCFICNEVLSDTEIQLAPDGTYEPCTECMEIALDAAYSEGFSPDSDTDPEIEDFGTGSVDTLEAETFRTVFDHCDPGYPLSSHVGEFPEV
jgi:hypothetical protein